MPHIYAFFPRHVLCLLLIVSFLLLLSVSPVFAAVEGFVVKSGEGVYHQYNYQELLDSYALNLLGMSNGLYEDFSAKKTVAVFHSQRGYIDYQDLLNAYAAALLSNQPFNMHNYALGSQAKQIMLPGTLKLVSLDAGTLVRKTAQNEEEAVVQPLSIKPPTSTLIIGKNSVPLQTAQRWATAKGAHQRFIDIAPLYWEYGMLTGIRPEVLYTQAAYETGFGRFGGLVLTEYNNLAGIKVGFSNEDCPDSFEQFATPEDGVRGHYNHVTAYVGLTPIGEPHSRYHVIARASWAGTIKTVEELSSIWAPSSNYHERIVAMLEEMRR